MAELLPQLLGVGGVGGFVVLLVYLLGSNRTDRKQARELITAADTRTAAAIAREDAARDELDKALDRIRELEWQVRRLQWELDQARPPVEIPPPPPEGGTP